MNLKQVESSDLVGQRNLRIEKLHKLKTLGINPYPAISNKEIDNSKVIENFESINGKTVSLTGRIKTIREHGKLVFMDIEDMSGKIQIYIKADELKEDLKNGHLGFDRLNLLDVSDFIEVVGEVTKTQRGEISLLATSIKLLTKALRPLPTNLEDKEDRFRRRYLDMNVHPEVRERFVRRAKFWNAVRDFYVKNGFVEVNIPVLEHTTGGADAKPFVTHYDALNEDFYLRISHELPLKRLIGGGFSKVFDIGPRFRNEGFSDEHLPEHVAMEWYWAYADYNDGMKLTEEMFRYVMQEVYGTLKFNIRGFEIDLSKEWQRIDYAQIIKERFNIDIYNDSLDRMREVLKANGHVDAEDPNLNINRAVDSLWKLIRKTIAGPAFLINEPKFMSPLAKSDENNPNVTQRFHALIAGSELVNAYSELNDPLDQLDRFIEQEKLRESGDDEAQMLDIDFVEMLEYGMPPTCGWGMSERVFWFFEGVTAKEGVPFPQLKYDMDNLTKEIYREVIKYNNRADKNSLEKPQDFNNKIVIVVNEELENWRKANAISHVAAYLGNILGEDFKTADFFVTQDGILHPRNSQYAIIILSAKPGQMNNFMNSVRDSGLQYHGFFEEMIDTTDDKEIVRILANKKDSEIEYYAVGIFGEKEKLDSLTKKYSLYK